MVINILVAASTNNAIGRNNQLLWHLPNDLTFFKNTTWGMPIIMGRKTFESIAKKPLPGRLNIIITQQKNLNHLQNNIDTWVTHSLEEAIIQAEQTDCKEAFVIGGAQIYKAAMPIAQRIYLTRVHANFEADTFLPEIDVTMWKQISCKNYNADEKHAYPYSFEVWESVKK